MALIYAGKLGRKKVFITPYCQRRLRQRNMSFKEVLHALSKRDVTYPVDADKREKIRSTLAGNKKVFLTIMEDSKKIIVITGGET